MEVEFYSDVDTVNFPLLQLSNLHWVGYEIEDMKVEGGCWEERGSAGVGEGGEVLQEETFSNALYTCMGLSHGLAEAHFLSRNFVLCGIRNEHGNGILAPLWCFSLAALLYLSLCSPLSHPVIFRRVPVAFFVHLRTTQMNSAILTIWINIQKKKATFPPPGALCIYITCPTD